MNMSCKELLLSLIQDESGQDLVEYALVMAAVVTMAIAASKSLTTMITGVVSTLSSTITTAI